MAEFSPQVEQQQQQSSVEVGKHRPEVSDQLGAVSVNSTIGSSYDETHRPLSQEEMMIRRQELASDNHHLAELDSLYHRYTKPRAEVMANNIYFS